MKIIFLMATLFGAQLAAAQVPNVKCFSRWALTDSTGMTIDQDAGASKKVITQPESSELRGYTISTQFERIFDVHSDPAPQAPNTRGRPSIVAPAELPPGPVPYYLTVEISKGKYKSTASTTVFANDPRPRLSIGLAIGNENLQLNCDQEL